VSDRPEVLLGVDVGGTKVNLALAPTSSSSQAG
jgi:N-acetylglucosamine kinase-like BadF-type ATPase